MTTKLTLDAAGTAILSSGRHRVILDRELVGALASLAAVAQIEAAFGDGPRVMRADVDGEMRVEQVKGKRSTLAHGDTNR